MSHANGCPANEAKEVLPDGTTIWNECTCSYKTSPPQTEQGTVLKLLLAQVIQSCGKKTITQQEIDNISKPFLRLLATSNRKAELRGRKSEVAKSVRVIVPHDTDGLRMYARRVQKYFIDRLAELKKEQS